MLRPTSCERRIPGVDCPQTPYHTGCKGSQRGYMCACLHLLRDEAVLHLSASQITGARNEADARLAMPSAIQTCINVTMVHRQLAPEGSPGDAVRTPSWPCPPCASWRIRGWQPCLMLRSFASSLAPALAQRLTEPSLPLVPWWPSLLLGWPPPHQERSSSSPP